MAKNAAPQDYVALDEAQLNAMLDELRDLADVLSHYDTADLLASAAALQLVPDNADRTIRLEVLSHIIAAQPYLEDKPQISKHKLNKVCNTPPLGKGLIESHEDPAPQAFAESFAFIGGSYTVFPGITADATFILRHLARAIFLNPEPFPNSGFAQSAHNACCAILTLSNEIAKRIDLVGNFASEPKVQQDVVVPNDLPRLKQAVIFTPDDVQQLLLQVDLPAAVLDDFIVEAGSVDFTGYDLQDGALQGRPLVRVGARLIVALPGCLLAALRHYLIVLATRLGVAEELARRYHQAVWYTIAGCFEDFGHHWLGLPLATESPLPTLTDGFWTLDTDKALYTVLITDDLSDYQEDRVFGEWKRQDIGEITEQRQLAAETGLLQNTQGLTQILVVYLYMGVGRDRAIAYGKPLLPLESPRLILNAAELEILALLEGSDPLALWKFTKASDDVRNTATVIVWSVLDEYQVYRDAGHSYYLSDGARPDLINLAPIGGGKLRREVLEKFDFHVVPSYARGYFAEVALLHETKKVPEYIILSEAGRDIHIFVECLPIPLWIVGPRDSRDYEAQGLRLYYTELADMMGYWLWQFAPELSTYLDPLRLAINSALILRFNLEPSPAWHSASQLRSLPPDEAVRYELLPQENEIVLKLTPGLLAIMATPDNYGERHLMRIALQAICFFMRAKGLVNEAAAFQQRIPFIIDTYAPLGVKKRLVITGSDVDVRLDPRGLSPFRKVQDWDVSNLLDQLGQHLTRTVGLKIGAIPADQRVSVLREVVDFFYQQLKKAVAVLSPERLLEFIVARHEAVIADAVNMRLTLPTRRACFENEPELIIELAKRIPENDLAANANRFLIEYVAARPPHGLRPISLEYYDQLLALAAEIYEWASDSDSIRYGFSDIQLSILPSGRLGRVKPDLTTAIDKFNPLRAREVMDRSDRAFFRHWQERTWHDPSAPPERVRELDEAFKAEFGLTLNEVTRFLSEIFNGGIDDTTPLKRIPLTTLVQTMAAILSWTEGKVHLAVELLSLKPREDFLIPPVPYQPEDVYPWRFGRPLSYLWRPLIQTFDNGVLVICWGNRHIFSSLEYIVGMCLSGRLHARAHTPEMRKLLGRIHTEQGELFNAEVAAVIQSYSNLVVRTQVRKIGRLRIGAPDADLGDIDILVAVPSQRKFMAIECKDLAVARTPREMVNELEELFADSDKKTAVVNKHLRRCEWLRQHLTEVLTLFALEDQGKWKVEPIMVVSDEMFTPHLYALPFPVYSLLRFQTKYLPWLFV